MAAKVITVAKATTVVHQPVVTKVQVMVANHLRLHRVLTLATMVAKVITVAKATTVVHQPAVTKVQVMVAIHHLLLLVVVQLAVLRRALQRAVTVARLLVVNHLRLHRV